MSRPIRVLILEDNPNDAELMVFELRRSGFPPTWQRVETEADFLRQLDPSLDIILADYSLPQFDGVRALRLLRERGLDIPVIVVTGALGDEKAAECMKQGAADYLLKDRLARLGPAVAQALDQKRLRDEKHQADERVAYQAQLLASVQDAVIASDNMELLTAWNPAAERIYGWSAEEALGRNGDELLHTEFVTLSRSDVIQRLLGEGRCRAEARQQCKDGRTVYVEMHLVALKNNAGQIVGYVGANRDITERKQLELELARHHAHLEDLIVERTQALHQAHEKLLTQERLAAVGQIAGNVAHQLRDPLAIVRDAVYMMKLTASARLDEKLNRQIAAAEGAVERCSHFIASLLDFARARPPEPTRNSLVYLVTEALNDADLPLMIKRKVLIPDRVPPVYVDRAQIMRAFANVVRNAHDVLLEGGVITIAATATGTTAEVRLTDSGPGIAPEVMKRLFDPLFTTKPHGAGLGLAIAKNFVEANHGTIVVESEPGKGTTVIITLPTA